MLTFAASYLHRLDPVILPISGSFAVRWYGVAYLVGFLIAWMMLRWFAATKRSPLTKQDVADLMFYGIVGVLVGGRLGHIIFYGMGKPLIEFSNQFPYWEALAVNRGGMSAHGGIAGVIIAACVFGWRRKFSSLHILDMAAFACLPGLCLGRVANFINAELWGRALPASMQQNPPWWSIKYPTQISERWLPVLNPNPQDAALHADVVRHAASDFHVPAEEVAREAMWRLDALDPLRDVVPGDPNHFYGRVIDAASAGNEQVIETLRPLLTAYYPSQIFQAITDGPILMGFLAILWLRPRKPGVIAAWFSIGYGMLRFATEVFRQPDEGVALLMGLSRGQVLSVIMILVGAIGLWIVTRRDAQKLGGLRTPSSTAGTA